MIRKYCRLNLQFWYSSDVDRTELSFITSVGGGGGVSDKESLKYRESSQEHNEKMVGLVFLCMILCRRTAWLG